MATLLAISHNVTRTCGSRKPDVTSLQSATATALGGGRRIFGTFSSLTIASQRIRKTISTPGDASRLSFQLRRGSVVEARMARLTVLTWEVMQGLHHL